MSTQADAVQSATPTTPAPALTPQQPHEILTVAEVASLLKCKESSIYNLTRRRGQVRYDNPIPVLRLIQIHPILKKNRPGDVWAKNIRPEPDFIQSLRVRVSEKYGVPFNSVQCNWHTGESEVSEHYDPYRVISMIRVGCTRVFEVGGQRQQGKDMYKYKPYPMPHGSLITFLSGGLTHRMFPEPSVGDCLSIIFRLVTPGQTTADWYPTDKLTYSKTRALHKKIYDGKVSEYRAKDRNT